MAEKYCKELVSKTFAGGLQGGADNIYLPQIWDH